MTTTKQIFTGDASQLDACYKGLAQQVTRLEDQVHKLTTSSERGMAGLLRGAAGAATQFIGLHAVIQSVNDDMAKMVRLQGEAAAAQRNLAGGQAEIILNTFGLDEKTVLKIAERGKEISAKYGLPQPLVEATAGRLMGAGVGPFEKRMEALEVAASLTRHTPEALGPTALAVQQTQKMTGMSAEEAASLMQSAGSAAFIGDPAMQARFLQQVMSGVVASSSGDRRVAAEQGLELGSWLTQVVGEERGESARTAGISLAAQMNEFFTEGLKIDGPGGMKLRVKPPEDPGSPIDRFRYLQEHPEFARPFLDRASFERLFESSIKKAILSPESAEAKLLAETEQTVKVDVPALKQQVQRLQTLTPQLATTTTAKQGETLVEHFKAELTRGGVTDSLRNLREEGQTAASRFRHFTPLEVGIGNKIGDVFGYFQGNEAERILEDLRFTRKDVLQSGALFPRGVEQLSPDERRVVDLLDKLIANGEQQLAQLKAISERERPQPPAVGPAANAEPGRHRER